MYRVSSARGTRLTEAKADGAKGFTVRTAELLFRTSGSISSETIPAFYPAWFRQGCGLSARPLLRPDR